MGKLKVTHKATVLVEPTEEPRETWHLETGLEMLSSAHRYKPPETAQIANSKWTQDFSKVISRYFPSWEYSCTIVEWPIPHWKHPGSCVKIDWTSAQNPKFSGKELSSLIQSGRTLVEDSISYGPFGSKEDDIKRLRGKVAKNAARGLAVRNTYVEVGSALGMTMSILEPPWG